MNIRKFIGGTSRDALRLVREALGADAVVLSNRTLDDGSVEIVALADRDLAAIAPADGAAVQGQGGSGAPFAQASAAMTQMARTPRAAPGSAPAALAAPAAIAGAGANPYASGMPDVFSSVFGASPQVGAEDDDTLADDANAQGDHANDAAVSLGQDAQAGSALSSGSAGSRAGAAPQAAQSPLPQTQAGMPNQHTPLQKALQAATGQLAKPAFAPLANPVANPAASAGPAFAREAASRLEEAASQYTSDAPRTMAESNPWLIDHARRIANQQNGVRDPGMTPASAAARGLGNIADPVLPPDVDATTPDWALEAAHVAARRAAQRLGHSPDAAGPAPTPGNRTTQGAAEGGANVAQNVSEAIRARIEQVVNETVMNELASMRGMMEEQFAGLMWGERQRRNPVQGALTKQLFAAGFSAQLVKMVIDRLPDVESEEAGMEWLQSVLESNLPVLENEEALMERGGVFALMGPTGVGKTTTTAKLAARCVMRFGASKVALLTTDSYRIGGHEQLRIFGKILGVSVHAVRDGADLQLALTELKNKHIVLIDTIGMSQRDRAVADQIAMLCGAGRPVQRLLLLSATNHGDTLNEVVQAYQSGPENAPLTGCILTKLDEATNLGSALDTVLRYKLPVHYVSTGQKVPENLYVATRRFLIRSAFCIPRDRSPFVPHEDDIPALLSALSIRSGSQAPEVRFG
ncbi:flagellar biosynthesis protein FlhF [Paraburkholderia mimosarum]|uniref:flagellar biosynthesis protein FlhF n=1 Tax=Paraburkholderia mimosarum TaxID=312026 RepID=UPI000485721B|nr:flagellar biosynthesis protein FlhF [Paraburkholderia mimosarum]